MTIDFKKRTSLQPNQVYCVLDYETFSEADLKKVGGYEYSMHPSTEVMCAAWRVGTRSELAEQLKLGTKAKFWAPRWNHDKRIERNGIDILTTLADPNIIKVAHNAMFEQVITLNVLLRHFPIVRKTPIINPAHWLCTATLAASHALPRKLENACAVMKLPIQKDMGGHKIMLKMCKPRKPTKNNPATRHNDPTDFKKLVKYCIVDVDAETHLFLKMPPLSVSEREVWILDQKINLRGFLVDRVLVIKILGMIKEEISALNVKLKKITNKQVETGGQVKEILKWVKAYGCFLPDLTADTILDALENDLATGKVKEVLKIRQMVSKTSTAKYKAFELRTRTDSRLRDALLYWAASTGRWGGKGVQPQNFPRGSFEDTSFLAEMCLTENLEMIRLLFGEPMEVFSSILRNMIISSENRDLFVSDYAGIETRLLFWMAGHLKGIEAFKQKRDLYKEMACVIYNTSLGSIKKLMRQVGKQTILGCGFAMGPIKFIATCAKYRIKVDEKTAKKAVKAYRTTHKQVPQMWKNIEKAAISAVLNPRKRYKANKTIWFIQKEFLYCELPSGRLLAYYGPEIKYVKTPWGEKAPKLYHWGVDGITRKWNFSGTYGGKLTENVVQATARDVTSEAILRIEKAGYDVLFHVHDEIIGEADKGKKTIEEFNALMEQIPEWAQGAPIDVEGWKGKRYKK